jgi:type II secretory pathway pseudopilin PulG
MQFFKSMKRIRPVRGFTIIEVVILLLIIALLLAMAIPALQKIRQAKLERATATEVTPPAKP